ncbi:MAG: flagellar motor protein [Methylococcales bacterium]
MDILSILGFLVGIGALLLGNSLDGGAISSLVNGPAMLIVFGGTVGATLLQVPPPIFIRSLKMFTRVFKPQHIDLKKQISKIVSWSILARKEGLLGLENEMDREKDLFVKKGLQLLVDGNEPEIIRNILQVDMSIKEDRGLQAARVYDAMGGYAPTIGILGAVMGLIHVMENLSNPALLGAGIATAFVATIYGVGSANLIFLPVASKLKNHVFEFTHADEMMIEGLVSIAEGENPKNIELKLSGFLPEKEQR